MRWLTLVSVCAVATVAMAAPVPKALKKATDETRIVGDWQERPGATSFWIFRDDGTAGVGDPANPYW